MRTIISGAPSSSRFNISTLSPHTGLLASSNCGGNFGYYLKKAGYDALILRGQAKEHTWLEITNDNIRAFSATAKKYGIDFALKKDSSTQPPRYLVFFKGRDADVMTAAFKEFSAKQLSQEKKPSIRKLLSSMKELAQKKDKVLDRTKHKDRGMEL